MSLLGWVAQLPDKDRNQLFGGILFLCNPKWNRSGNDCDRFIRIWDHVTCGVPDARYQRPNYLDEKHFLWPVVKEALEKMPHANDLDELVMIIEELNLKFRADDVQIPAINQLLHSDLEKRNFSDDYNEVPYTFVDFESVEEAVAALRDEFVEKALEYGGILHGETLQRGFPSQMIWHPPEAWKYKYANVYHHLQTMIIPKVPFSENEPDLLLHALGSFQTVDPKISQRLNGFNRQFSLLADTSGAGKTRYIFEYLARIESGFYFTFEVDRTTSPYGSADLGSAILLMSDRRFRQADQPPFVPVVEHSDISDGNSVEKQRNRWGVRWENNDRIARHSFTNLLLARLLVYDAFWEAVDQCGGINETTSKRAWCLLQVAPHLSGVGDIFLNMYNAVQLVKLKVAEGLIKRLLARFSAAQDRKLTTLAIDEAQSGTRIFPTCFGPHLETEATEFAERMRPVLKPLVQTVYYTGDFERLIVSGTKVDQDAVKEAIMSTIGKQGTLSRDLANLLGQNDEEKRIHAILDTFFGEGFAKRLKKPTQREILFWMQGRPRFLAVLVSALLQTEPSDQNVYDVLMDLVSKLSGHDVRRLPGKPSFSWIKVDNIVSSILQEPKTDDHKEKVRDLETVLVNFLLTRRYDRHQHDKALEWLVEIGIGRFAKPYSGKPTIKVIFNENLILIALWAWFSIAPQGGKSRLHRYLQLGKAAANPSIAGFGWEDVVAYMLRRWIVGVQHIKVDDVFEFIGERKPHWATEEFILIEALLENQDGKLVPIPASFGMTQGLTQQTKDAEETFQRIQPNMLEEDTNRMFQQRCYPFIKPDELMGPDLLAIAQLPSDGTLILIAVQCKDLSDSLSTKEIEDILEKLAPVENKGWWCRGGKRSRKCQEYVEAIESLFPVSGTKYEGTDADADVISRDNRSTTLDMYHGHPRCAVLRVIAAPELNKLDSGTRIGPWSAAVLSRAAMECTAESFSSIRTALQDAQDAEQTEIQEARAKKLRQQPVAKSRTPVPARKSRVKRLVAEEDTPRKRRKLATSSKDQLGRARSVGLNTTARYSATPSDERALSDDIDMISGEYMVEGESEDP